MDCRELDCPSSSLGAVIDKAMLDTLLNMDDPRENAERCEAELLDYLSLLPSARIVFSLVTSSDNAREK